MMSISPDWHVRLTWMCDVHSQIAARWFTECVYTWRGINLRWRPESDKLPSVISELVGRRRCAVDGTTGVPLRTVMITRLSTAAVGSSANAICGTLTVAVVRGCSRAGGPENNDPPSSWWTSRPSYWCRIRLFIGCYVLSWKQHRMSCHSVSMF